MRTSALLAVALLNLAVGCTRPTTRFVSTACAEDSDCELTTLCCSCCQEVAMTRVDAQAEHDRCTTVECRTECVSDDCPVSGHKATCRDGQCVAVPGN